ncbi:unnamed protein product [Amoebophrya sp. A25]|nr:unnamed protein product [Amoebophrya sp. A25]|eukprot:GSA25T00001926001.1
MKSLAIAVDLAKRAVRYSEGRIWLAFLQSAQQAAQQTKDQDGSRGTKPAIENLLEDEDRLELLEMFDPAEDLAESFLDASATDPELLKRKLDKLLVLEKTLARPVVDMEGNQVVTVHPEHYTWNIPAPDHDPKSGEKGNSGTAGKTSTKPAASPTLKFSHFPKGKDVEPSGARKQNKMTSKTTSASTSSALRNSQATLSLADASAILSSVLEVGCNERSEEDAKCFCKIDHDPRFSTGGQQRVEARGKLFNLKSSSKDAGRVLDYARAIRKEEHWFEMRLKKARQSQNQRG